jgi:hypothetical protein
VQLSWYTNGGIPASDNFPGSSLSGNWTKVGSSNYTVSSGYIAPSFSGTNNIYWNAVSFTRTQCSSVTIGTPNANGGGPAVLESSSGSYLSGASTSGLAAITKYTVSGDAYSNLTTVSHSFTAGDVLKLCSNGAGGLTAYLNGSSILTASDSTWTTGQPGIFGYGPSGTPVGVWIGSVN